MLGANVLSPLYSALMVCMPPMSADVMRLAESPDNGTDAPKATPLVLNCTVPESVPLPGGTIVTVAVKVIDSPAQTLLVEAVMVVDVGGLFTVCVKSGEVLALKFPSPLYTAVTVCVPSVNEAIAELVAVPPDRVTGAPKSDPSILNWTVPVGVPDPGDTTETVAVNVTDWPKIEGLTELATAVVVLALEMVKEPLTAENKPALDAVSSFEPTVSIERLLNVAKPEIVF